MHSELKEKIKRYLTQFTSQAIQLRIKEEVFPFFGEHAGDCLELAWEVIADRSLKDCE